MEVYKCEDDVEVEVYDDHIQVRKAGEVIGMYKRDTEIVYK